MKRSIMSIMAAWLCACSVNAATGSEFIKQSGVTGGLVVHVNCGDAKLTGELYGGVGFVVQGLETDARKIARARANLRQKNLYGKVTVAQFDGEHLPYINNVVTLLVADKTKVPEAEILRVLQPLGVAIIDGRKVVKPWPEEMDEWTHYLYDASNNAVGNDKLVGAPHHMQWVSDPVWTRHHDNLASMSTTVTSQGRIFSICDKGPVHRPDFEARWVIEARNAFNGIKLWERPMKSWVEHTRKFRSGPVQIARLLVAGKDRIFTVMGLNEPVVTLDAATGKDVAVIPGTEKTEEMIYDDNILAVLVAGEATEHSLAGRTKATVDYKQKVIKAIDTRNNKVLWQWPEEGVDIIPQTMAIAQGGLYCQVGDSTVKLDLKTGKELWNVATFEKKKQSGRPSKFARHSGWSYNTLVVYKDVVFSSNDGKLVALNAGSGEKLWDCPAKPPFPKTPAIDVLVINDLVWLSPHLNTGRDYKTGKVVKELDTYDTLTTKGHHHRCYRNKGCDDFILFGYRGIDLIDTVGDNHSRNNWVRGLCQYGIMSANGLLYAPPHNCGCYMEAMLHGYWALASENTKINIPADFKGKLEKGPAYAKATAGKSAETDWPTYRGDMVRSGITTAEAGPGSELGKAWNVKIGTRLTAPVAVKGMVLLTDRDSCTVYALDETNGKVKWTFAAEAPVDSPPTIYKGRAIFGTKAGFVYALDAATGEVAWRFDAKPQDLNTIAFNQVESLWPVHGSILVKNGVAYFAAGRSSYLDGGVFLFALDAVTGEVKYQNRVSVDTSKLGRIERPPADRRKTRGKKKTVDNKQSNPDLRTDYTRQNKTDYKSFAAPDKSDAFSMFGNKSDVMVGDDDSVYLRHMRFDDNLKYNPNWKHHLFSTSTLLDSHEAHRSHWFYGTGNFRFIPVAYEWSTRNTKFGGFNTALGTLLLVDKERNMVFGVYRPHDLKTELFAFDITDIDKKFEKDFPTLKGEAAAVRVWSQFYAMHPRAFSKAGDVLYMAGAKTTDQLTGNKAGLLITASDEDGGQIGRLELPSPPIFDGMAIANGKLFITLEDGSVLCLTKGNESKVSKEDEAVGASSKRKKRRR